MRQVETQHGASLIEALLALLLLSVGCLALAPMFVHSAQINTVGADQGSVGALGVERMEILRAQPFSALGAGGNLDSDVAGYFDSSNTGFRVRWTVVDNAIPPGTKTIVVRVTADRQVIGNAEEVQLSCMRAR